jgi:hypothetical protein
MYCSKRRPPPALFLLEVAGFDKGYSGAIFQRYFGIHLPIKTTQKKEAFEQGLEAISKFRIRFEGKAQGGEKAEHTRAVCEHFEPTCNTAIGPQTGF